MSLLKKILEDAAVATTAAASVAGVREPLMKKKPSKKKKKEKKTSMLKRVMEAGEAGDASFDEADVVSKLKDSEKTFDDSIDTVGFALEDGDGRVVKVFVRSEQAKDFEEALAAALDDTNQSEAEIAEILFDFRNQFDIVNIVWPTIPEDEEVDNELAGGEDELAGDELGAEGDDELGLDDEGGDELDMTADETGGEEAAGSALEKVIAMMTADAEARKAEAEAKKAQAETETGKYAAQAAAAKVKAEEEILDMEAYNKKKAEEDKEAKRLAQLAKYKHDLAADEASDAMSMESYVSEGRGDSFKRKFNKAFWWDGYVNPKEMRERISKMSDSDLVNLSDDILAKAKGDGTPRSLQIKLINRELKRRFGVTPKGNLKEATKPKREKKKKDSEEAKEKKAQKTLIGFLQDGQD